jgi:hypothetical protein
VPRGSSSSPRSPSRWDTYGFIPPILAHWSSPEYLDDGFAVDVWAERPVGAGDVSELQAAARLLARPTLMTAPASVRGVVTLDNSRLVVSVFMFVAGSGAYGPSMGAIAESSMCDLWNAVHLASRPEAAHLRTADQVLALARIRRAMA